MHIQLLLPSRYRHREQWFSNGGVSGPTLFFLIVKLATQIYTSKIKSASSLSIMSSEVNNWNNWIVNPLKKKKKKGKRGKCPPSHNKIRERERSRRPVCYSFYLWHTVVFTALSLRWTAQTAAPPLPTLLTHCAPQNSCSANATCCRFLLLWRATTTGSSVQSNQQIAADVASGTFTQKLLQFRGFTSMTICFPPPTALCLHKRLCISPQYFFERFMLESNPRGQTAATLGEVHHKVHGLLAAILQVNLKSRFKQTGKVGYNQSMSRSTFNCEVLNHIRRHLKALCTIKEETDWSLQSEQEATVASRGNAG